LRKTIVIFMSLLMFIFPLAACSGGGSKSITIGAQTYTEMKILAYMYKELIEEQTDITVEVKEDLATSPLVLEGLQNGDLDIGTLLSGTIANFTEIDNPQDPQATWEQARDIFAGEEYNLKYLERLGYENTYAFTIRNDLAEEHGIEKVSDMKDIAGEFSAGFDTSWLERKYDGYPYFVETYQFEFGETNPMEIGLVYDAVKNREVDIVLAYTSDARITAFDLVTLEDDKHFFPPYDAAPIIRQELLDEYPEVEDAISPLVGRFTDESIRELNGKVDLEGNDIEDVAIEYLKSENLIE